MLRIDYEFRKGIFFLRLSGNFEKNNYYESLRTLNNLIKQIGIKNIVLNIDNIISIDIYGINFIINYYNYIKSSNGSFIICEKDNCISNNILKNKIPCVTNEIKAFNLL